MSTRRTRNPQFVPIGLRECLVEYVKYNTKFFFLGLAYCSESWMDFDPEWHKRRAIIQGCAFWGVNDGQPHLGGQIPENRQKWSFCWHFESGVKINDVTEQ